MALGPPLGGHEHDEQRHAHDNERQGGGQSEDGEGAQLLGVTMPQFDRCDTPRSMSPKPRAATTVPATSKRVDLLAAGSDGTRKVASSTRANQAAMMAKVRRKPAESMTTPRTKGDRVDRAAAPAMVPKAMARWRPWYSAATSPRTEGVIRQAPSPMMTRPPQVNTAMEPARAATASPARAMASPTRRARRSPMVTPTRPPAIMKAPAMRENRVVATWMSSRVAPRDPTRLAVARFMAALSLEVPIWARASTARGT